MKSYLEKFDNQYKGKQTIDIFIFNEEPLSIKHSRSNQSGEQCYCKEGSNEANQKTKNGWQKVNCDRANCQYKQKDSYGKTACKRMGWFKFIIPSVCEDRIFLMRITGQTSINRLNDYFKLQKSQGKSIKGFYSLILKQEEQSNSLGKTFNNYILDIIKKDNFISQNTIPENIEKPKELSTKNDQNVNKETEESNIQSPTLDEKKEEKQTKKSITKSTKSKPKKTQEDKKDTDTKNDENSTLKEKYPNTYILVENKHKEIAGKDYLVPQFVDMEDKLFDIAVRPEVAAELENCETGTYVKMVTSEVNGQLFAIEFEFVQKMSKKIAA